MLVSQELKANINSKSYECESLTTFWCNIACCTVWMSLKELTLTLSLSAVSQYHNIIMHKSVSGMLYTPSQHLLVIQSITVTSYRALKTIPANLSFSVVPQPLALTCCEL